MRAALIFIVVIAIALIFAAIKYRRQIVRLIGIYKQFQAIRSGLKQNKDRLINSEGAGGIQLVKCERCGKWIPVNESIGDSRRTVCARDCKAINAV